MTKMRSFQLNLLRVLYLFTTIYPYEVGTIIIPVLHMEETEAQKASMLCTVTQLINGRTRI